MTVTIKDLECGTFQPADKKAKLRSPAFCYWHPADTTKLLPLYMVLSRYIEPWEAESDHHDDRLLASYNISHARTGAAIIRDVVSIGAGIHAIESLLGLIGANADTASIFELTDHAEIDAKCGNAFRADLAAIAMLAQGRA